MWDVVRVKLTFPKLVLDELGCTLARSLKSVIVGKSKKSEEEQ